MPARNSVKHEKIPVRHNIYLQLLIKKVSLRSGDKLEAESTTSAPSSETRMWYFRPGYDEKSYTQHEDKEGHPRAHVCHPRLRLGCQFTRALDWPTLYLPCCVIYYHRQIEENLFHHTRAENTTFAFWSRERKWYFRPGYDEKFINRIKMYKTVQIRRKMYEAVKNLSENQHFPTVSYSFLRFSTVSYGFLHLLFPYGVVKWLNAEARD